MRHPPYPPTRMERDGSSSVGAVPFSSVIGRRPPPIPPFFGHSRVEPVRFGSITVRLWNGSSGSGFRFRRFPWKSDFSCVSVQINREARFRFQFRFLKNGSGGSGSAFGFRKTVPTVPVSGSGSVPETPCHRLFIFSA